MDYRVLLIKYIFHVYACEGVTYISWCKEPDFTKEEIEELKKLEKGGE